MKIKASTQEHLDIANIRDDFVVLKNGNVSAVLETTAVNFDLLSEREQDAMIEAYGSLLNSLSFPIQILIRSKRLNISTYVNKLQEKKKTRDEASQKRLDRYIDFIKKLTQKNEVLDKNFYVVIPYREMKITVENPLKKAVARFQGQPEPTIELSPEDLSERVTPKIAPRVSHLIKQFSRIGIKAKRLKTEELIKLFYEIYND